MALGREVDDRARAMLRQQRIDERAVADVAVLEHVARVALQRLEVGQIARVRERVEVDDVLVVVLEPVEDEIATDEAGAAGDQNHVAPSRPPHGEVAHPHPVRCGRSIA